MDRICSRDECQIVYSVSRPSDPKKYCSRSCSAKVNNKTHPKRQPEGSCKKCGDVVSTRTTYCGNCFYNLPPRTVGNPPTSREVSCSECHNSFKTTSPHSKYCSDKCRNKGHNQRSTCDCGKSKSVNSTRCLECYRNYTTSSSTLRADSLIDSWLAGSWSGGSVRKVSQTVRKYLLEKANYGCERCGFDTPHPVDGQTILEIDHIDGDGSNHRPENLRVLCPNCHALTPTYRARNIGNGRKVYYLRVDREDVDITSTSVVE